MFLALLLSCIHTGSDAGQHADVILSELPFEGLQCTCTASQVVQKIQFLCFHLAVRVTQALGVGNLGGFAPFFLRCRTMLVLSISEGQALNGSLDCISTNWLLDAVGCTAALMVVNDSKDWDCGSSGDTCLKLSHLCYTF